MMFWIGLYLGFVLGAVFVVGLKVMTDNLE